MSLQPEYSRGVDDVVPGVTAAYELLRADNEMGLYTSAGAQFNHTLFGRDASSTVALVAPFDHEVGRESIIALAALQGTKSNAITQEQPGRIHHEYRDFRSWKPANLWDKMWMKLFYKLWDGENERLLTYYSADSTAAFINLVHTYVEDVDRSILDEELTNKDGEQLVVREAVKQAADWLISQTGEDGIVATQRSKGWSLYYQTYQDSTTAYGMPDGKLANYKRPLAYAEVQGMSIDALRSASAMIEEDDRAPVWRHTADRIAAATLEKFWMEDDQYFASALERGDDGNWRQVTTRNISASWLLNTSLFHNLDNQDRERYIAPVVRRLFSDEFLTDLGLRTRSIKQPGTLHNVMEYHGAHTVWPMFTHLAVRGLLRHHMTRLASQLEHRVINTLKWSKQSGGSFDEFYIVDNNGHVFWDPRDHKASLFNPKAVGIQMFPEKDIAFTVVSSLAMAHRIAGGGSTPTQRPWQTELESEILSKIKNVNIYEDEDLELHKPPISSLKVSRSLGWASTLAYMLEQKVRLKR